EAEVIDLGRGTAEEFAAHAREIPGRIVLVRHEMMFAAGTIHRRFKIAAARELLAGCNNCHQIDPLDQSDYPGPTLVNVSRRDIGSVPGFAYSEALQTRKGVWTKENMRRYLWSPNSFAPGTTMPR
ncbi:MAG: hypothetical protein AAFZ09_00665, partial [Pseudomonadota bacterium]